MRILRQRNFALVWSANMMGAMGNQTKLWVLGWFVLTLTDSPFLVGLITAARLFMNPLAVFAGAIADRVPEICCSYSRVYVAATGLLMLGLIITDSLDEPLRDIYICCNIVRRACQNFSNAYSSIIGC
ncbi:MAG: hypothetical protein CM1200mP15_05560 [Dehalococcoidia bacterium]|nr:MAG: hypothetical protein CM1200mP15_05560 [Dehalococcoidia bacterium]